MLCPSARFTKGGSGASRSCGPAISSASKKAPNKSPHQAQSPMFRASGANRKFQPGLLIRQESCALKKELKKYDYDLQREPKNRIPGRMAAGAQGAPRGGEGLHPPAR